MSHWKLRLQKSLVLVSVGAMPLALPFLNCAQNRDLELFFQTVGTASIDVISDNVLDDGVDDSEYDQIVRAPLTDLLQALWSNYTFQLFPQDPSRLPVVRQ